MKLPGTKIAILENEDPINVTSSLNVTGGSLVQFFDGVNYSPNRAGTPSSPILLDHTVSAVKQSGAPLEIEYSTLFYENDTLIDASNSSYELLDSSLKVKKNVPGGTSLVIRAVSKFIDPITGVLYERQDTVTLRTLIKAELPYQLELDKRGAIYFDGHRNPNVTTNVTAVLKRGGENIPSYSGITFKWLNAAGIDAVENELYGVAYSNGNRTITIDQENINHELIRCEAWIGSEMIASDTVTFIRKFNSFRFDIRIPELPLQIGVNSMNCSIEINDILGNVDATSAFIVTWMVTEGSTDRELATGNPATIPVSSINMNASPEIWVDLKRKEAFAALVTDADELLTDDDGAVLTIETFGI